MIPQLKQHPKMLSSRPWKLLLFNFKWFLGNLYFSGVIFTKLCQSRNLFAKLTVTPSEHLIVDSQQKLRQTYITHPLHHHASPHAPIHGPSLPVEPEPNPTPPNLYGMGLHDTAALYCVNTKFCTANLRDHLGTNFHLWRQKSFVHEAPGSQNYKKYLFILFCFKFTLVRIWLLILCRISVLPV